LTCAFSRLRRISRCSRALSPRRARASLSMLVSSSLRRATCTARSAWSCALAWASVAWIRRWSSGASSAILPPSSLWAGHVAWPHPAVALLPPLSAEGSAGVSGVPCTDGDNELLGVASGRGERDSVGCGRPSAGRAAWKRRCAAAQSCGSAAGRRLAVRGAGNGTVRGSNALGSVSMSARSPKDGECGVTAE